jgi:acyl-CoA synthetase (AMP-forming)/AMP-acid ligase II/acyl carrier protein
MSTPRPAIVHGPALRVPVDAPESLPTMLARASRQRPSRGITYVHRDGSESVTSYAELWTAAQRVAAGLARAGLGPGDVALLTLDDERDLLTALWGALLAGVVAVPLRLAGAPQSRVQTARLLGCWERLERPPVVTSRSDSDWATPWSASRSTMPRCLALAELALHAPGAAASLEPDDVALLILTSGSTGNGKLVAHSHRTILAQCIATVQANGFTCDDVTLNWFPLDHVGGLAMSHMRDVFLGCRQVQAPMESVLRDPVSWLDWIERYRATVTWAPNFAYALVASRTAEHAARRHDLSSMRFLLNGGESIVARQARRFLAQLEPHGLPPDAMHPAWGMSETCSGLTYSARFSVASSHDDDAFVDVGTPLPGTSLRIVDDDGRMRDEGEVGLLEVRGPSLTLGYYGDPAATAALFSSDGWLRTGDLALVREGSLVITGRAKDILVIGGVNHAAREIETLVNDVPGVATGSAIALAVRLPDDATDRLAVVFSPTDAGAADDTIALIRTHVAVAAGVTPRLVRALDPDAVPRSAIGKVQRAVLAEQLVAGLASQLDPGPPAVGHENTLAERVRDIVGRTLQASPAELDFARPLEDQAPFDSLALVEILTALEQALTVRIRGDRLPRRVTLDDLVRLALGPGAAR